MRGKPSERPEKVPTPEQDEAPVDSAAEADESTGGDGGGGPDEASVLDVELELARHRDAMLRMQAGMENLRKRL